MCATIRVKLGEERMSLAAMLTSLPLDFAAAVREVARLGFAHVDIVAVCERDAADREVLAECGVMVACASVGRALPEGCALDAADLMQRHQAVAVVKRQLTDAAQLGATWAYLVPGTDASPAALQRFADSCQALEAHARGRMMQLCLEHIPGRALPTVAKTLSWLKKTELALLLDIGHCLISEEDPVLAVMQAGDRLGYVHLDDNDSVGDLHWPLLTGRLTRDMLVAFFAVLREVKYRGGMSLELNPKNADPILALRQGREIVENHWSLWQKRGQDL
ncbi:MAG TPA: sugar phosphate isomerase/epimerase [Gemmataceae bacterium]|nr:sugar phosphate isomerase/epimerase [Gemmataceae bacterium]